MFEKLLVSNDLNKKQFSALTGLSYQTIMNWNTTNKVPKWVKSWLENYKKAKRYDSIVEAVRPYIYKKR